MTPFLAYLDPGAGSILLQAVIGGLLGGAMVMKIFWKKIKELFGQKSEIAEEGHDSADE